MPVYNGEATLRAAIGSILAQTFRDFELIIVDNGSTDGTWRICEEYVQADNRVRYFRNPRNLGVCENYNEVFRHARAPFFKWASANDVCHPDLLGHCLDTLRRRDTVVLAHPCTCIIDDAGGKQEFHEDLDLRQPDPAVRFRLLLERMRLNNMMNGVLRAEVLRGTPLHRPFFGSDISLMAEVALHGEIAQIPEYLFFRRMNRNSATKLRSESEIAEFYRPGSRRTPLFSLWRLHGHLIGAVRRAPIGLRSRLRLFTYIVRRMVWQRGDLLAEIREGLRRLAGKAHARPAG